MNMNREVTIRTLANAGREDIREFTTNLSPSFLPITLNGRKALKVLRALSDYRALLLLPEKLKEKSTKEARTTTKSSTFQKTRIYALYPEIEQLMKPKAIIFIKASKVNKKVNPISARCRYLIKGEF